MADECTLPRESALKKLEHWRAIAHAGATLSGDDLSAWVDAIDAAKAELEGIAHAVEQRAFPVGSTGAVQAMNYYHDQCSQVARDCEAVTARFKRITDEAAPRCGPYQAAMQVVADRMEAHIAALKALPLGSAIPDDLQAEIAATQAERERLKVEGAALRTLLGQPRAKRATAA